MSDLLAAMVDVVDALTQPTQHRTPQHTWSKDRRDRNKKRLPDHVTYVPGLLDQLAELAEPLGVNGEEGAGSRSVPQSREPGNPRALAAYLDIHIAVMRWTIRFELVRRDTLASSVRQLLGAAGTRPSTVQADLLADMSAWLNRCEHAAGLVVPDPMLTVPCPDLMCQARMLRVDVPARAVRCVSCGMRWAARPDEDDDRVGLLDDLATYVVKYRARAAKSADEAWAAERRRKEAMFGHPARS